MGIFKWLCFCDGLIYLGQVLVFIFKRKEKKWTVSSLPGVLIISLNTLALTSALQPRHLTQVLFHH